MSPHLLKQHYQWKDQQVELVVPDAEWIKARYNRKKVMNDKLLFPYWAQVWPSALALCQFMVDHPVYVQNKNVLELAAGLGLPSMLAAHFAKEVCCSDYMTEAVEVMKLSVEHNGLQNINCRVLDWNDLPGDLFPDVLLLSDVNYEPETFEVLFEVLVDFIKKDSTILLSTPQRLMAKPFIEKLLPFCKSKQEVLVSYQHEKVFAMVYVLAK